MWVYAISCVSPLLFLSKWILIWYPLLSPLCLPVQPPLETSLSSSLHLNGSPFPPPLSQHISRSCGGAAVSRYVSGDSTTKREEDGSLDYMPASLEDFHSTWPVWFRDWNRHKDLLKNRGTHCNMAIRWKIHSTGEDVRLSLARATSQLMSFWFSVSLASSRFEQNLNETSLLLVYFCLVCTQSSRPYPVKVTAWITCWHGTTSPLLFDPVMSRACSTNTTWHAASPFGHWV